MSDEFPIIITHNRDEELSRETSEPFVSEDGILCSLDIRAMGTWLGVNTKTGAFAMLTNCALHAKVDELHVISRGKLVAHLLSKEGDLSIFNEWY